MNSNFLFNLADIWERFSVPIIIGIVALVLLIVLIVVLCKCKKAEKNFEATESVAPAQADEQPGTEESSEPQVIVVEEAPEEVVSSVTEEDVAPAVEESEIATENENSAVTEEKPTEKPTAAKKRPAKKPAAEQKEPAVATTTVGTAKPPKGRWTVEFKKNGEYMAKLHASNGEEMLSSEIYSSEEGARNGIQSIINSVDTGKFIIYCDKANNYYYKLKTSNNRLMCVGEIYKTRERCQKAVDSVKRIAKDAVISGELVKGTEYVEYTPVKKPVYEVKNGATGKWKIEQNEEGKYSAKLYASNGQLMLATEEVSLLKSAENAIESVKKNSAAGHFIIDRDKFGRFYYKLRNAQKSVICIGEAYKSLDSCISALESVRRFAATAVVEEF